MTRPYESTQSLTGEPLALLLEEVGSMAASNRSLSSGFSDLEAVAMGKIGRAALQVRHQIESGSSAADSIALLSDQYARPIRQAMELLLTTGSITPIHEAARMIRLEQQQKHQFWLASITPILNVLAAATVLFFVLPFILVSVAKLEPIQSRLSPTAVEIAQTFAGHFALAAIAFLLGVAAITSILFAILNLSNRRIEKQQEIATFCRWLAMHAGHPCDVSHAIESSADVVGRDFLLAWSPTIENIRRGNQSLETLAMPTFCVKRGLTLSVPSKGQTPFQSETSTRPDPISQCIVDWVSQRRGLEEIKTDLHLLADLHFYQANQRRIWWIEAVPRWVAATVLIAMISLILQSVISPLFDAIGEIAR